MKVNAKRKEIDGERLMQGLLCVRSNGKDWGCSRQALFVHTMCEHHYKAHLIYENIKRTRKRLQLDANSLSYPEDWSKKSSTVGTETKG